MKILKEEVTPKNIFYYLQGNIRYMLFYSKLYFLIPLYIREQIRFRLKSMDINCYKQGQCKMCGCQTTMLQMSDKACNKPCYPSMLSRKGWETFKKTSDFYDKRHNIVWSIDKEFNVFVGITK